MFSVICSILGVYSNATTDLPLETWRLIAVALLARHTALRHLAKAVSGYAVRLTAEIRALLSARLSVVPASCLSFEDAGAIQNNLRSPTKTSKPGQADRSRVTQQALPRIYLDLTDVVSHAIWHDSCAGIPRVQLEVATKLAQSNPSVSILGLHLGQWYELRPIIEFANGDVDAIFSLLKETFFESGRTLKGLRAFFNKRRRKFRSKRHARAPELKAEDTLFIGGAFWVNKETINFCKRAAANRATVLVLVHDLIPITNPDFTGHDFQDEYFEILSLPIHFIVTTHLNRRELERVRQQANAASLVTCSSIVPLADEFPGSPRNAPPLATTDRLAGLIACDFVLCVGTIEVRKNHLTLLAVWDELATELGHRLPLLVIAGRRGWKADDALAKLDAARAFADRIIFIEAPTDRELQWLYSSCLFTIFPSFFEGWGLPIGESFWFGKPCAASNTSSIPTVGRDLCAYFSPYDPQEMKNAIRLLLNPETRYALQQQIESAPLRSWSDVAHDIESVINQRPPAGDPFQRPPHSLELDGGDRLAADKFASIAQSMRERIG